MYSALSRRRIERKTNAHGKAELKTGKKEEHANKEKEVKHVGLL
jgi:hypothetical protein